MEKLDIQLFAEEDEQQEDQTTEDMYLEQIQELKAKMDNDMISKEEYLKLKAQHKKLMDDFVNRRPVVKKTEKTIRPAKDVASEISMIKNADITNREYIAKALEYRASHIHQYGTDPFTDFGSNGPNKPTEETNMVASTLQTLLDENPSPVDFRIKLNSILQDDPQLLAKLRKRA